MFLWVRGNLGLRVLCVLGCGCLVGYFFRYFGFSVFVLLFKMRVFIVYGFFRF